jgi:hypothetical protein
MKTYKKKCALNIQKDFFYQERKDMFGSSRRNCMDLSILLEHGTIEWIGIYSSKDSGREMKKKIST